MEERIQKVIGPKVVVRRPPNPAFGDYAVFIGADAGEAAKTIAKELGATATKVEAAKGFVNITLSREAVTLAVAEADAKGQEWGNGSINQGQRVMIEYTDPNPFKEMHIGHLMSNAIGEAIARLISNQGARVIRANWQGDVGPHVAKAVWGKMQKPELEWGDAYAYGAQSYEDHREEIDDINKAIYEKSNPAINTLYEQGRADSLERFEHLYRILGTKFDCYFFEGDEGLKGIDIVDENLKKGVFEKSDGAIVFKGEPFGLHTRVFITSKGLPTYETKELGLNRSKLEREPELDMSVIVTGNEQEQYFKVLLKVMALVMPEIGNKTVHVSHGMMRLASGKMSSRAGNVITAADFIEDVVAKSAKRNPDPLIAEQVAVGAIKYMVLRQAPGSDIVFDEEKSLSLEGDSGPYLQYALVRARSVLANAPTAPAKGAPKTPYLLERLTMHFPEIAARASRELAPNLLVNYLTELAQAWNAFYAAERIVGGEYESHKLLVTRAFAQTMKNGLSLLGIPAPEKM